MQNTSIVQLTNAHSYTGPTQLTSGTLQLGGNNLLPNVTAVTIAGGATLDLKGYAETIGNLRFYEE